MTKRRISRRTFLKRTMGVGLGTGAAAATGFGYTYYGEPNWLAVEHVDVPIRDLAAGLHGLKIVQLSDFHLSQHVSAQHVAQAVALANQQQPDITVLTGDFITYGVSYIAQVLPLLAPLRARLGVFAVLGNHDYWTGAPHEIIDGLALHGVRTFRNGNQRINAGADALWMIGVDDVWERHHNLAAAMDGVPERATRLLLVHEPDIADQVGQFDVDLQLSGHSHGGQVRLPFVGPVVLPRLGQQYPIGLQRVPGSATQVYTSRGIGLVGPPVRFNCRPEVAVLRLVPQPA